MNDAPTCLSPARPAGEIEHFAARCAHDLNNLLTGILGNLELMQNRARRNGIKDFDGYMEGARQAASRAAEFTRRLLIFSGHTAQSPAPVPVNTLIRDLIDAIGDQAGGITADLAEDAGDVFCDQAQLELALKEVLANAREAVGDHREVTLRTRAAGAEVEIVVTDNGAGMSPEILSRCTEPFFTTRPGGAGKGLGLTIVANIIAQAGGTTNITSDNGTTVTLRLPRHAS